MYTYTFSNITDVLIDLGSQHVHNMQAEECSICLAFSDFCMQIASDCALTLEKINIYALSKEKLSSEIDRMTAECNASIIGQVQKNNILRTLMEPIIIKLFRELVQQMDHINEVEKEYYIRHDAIVHCHMQLYMMIATIGYYISDLDNK